MSHERNVLDDHWALDGQPGPARRLPDRQVRAMVQTALFAMDAGLGMDAGTAPEPASHAPVPPRPRIVLNPVSDIQAVTLAQSRPSRLRGRRFVWLLAAAIVFGAAATSAGVYRWLGGRAPREAPADTGHESAQRAPEPARDPAPEPAPEPTPAPAPADQPAPVSPPVPEVAERPRSRPARAEARAERRASSQVRVEPATPPTPDDLMKQANEQRRARNWQAAEALYQRVTREHPGTSAAHVAAIAAAAIRLDHLGDARGALRLYRTALAGGRALAEEARWGLAEAHRALGDTAGEQRALEDFVARHPGSPLIPQAQSRLRALQAKAP